uniref:Uncharacterized protein n=1 Tax=Stomoxys calcitrans TaxID=35570 RepID=A0A2Y9D4M5_STOCA
MKFSYINTICLLICISYVNPQYHVLQNSIGSVTKCLLKFTTTREESKTYFDNPDKTSHNFKCFLKCMVEEEGFFQNGSPVAELVFETHKTNKYLAATSEELLEVIERCHALVGDDDCDTVFKISRCFDDIVYGKVHHT